MGFGKKFLIRGGFMRAQNHFGMNGKHCHWIYTLCILAISFAAAGYGNAQSTGGRVRGTVTDPSGGAVTGAKLVLTNEANGKQRDTLSGSSGEYIFLEMPVGTYQIEVSQKGKYTRRSNRITCLAACNWPRHSAPPK